MPSSLFFHHHHHHHRAGRQDLRWKSTPPRDDGNSSRAATDASVEIGTTREIFFVTLERGDKERVERAFDRFPEHTADKTNGWRRSVVFPSASSSKRKRAKNIYHKKRTTKNRTHHTPTQEYVVPKSIPIAGPSDLDILYVY